VGIDFHALKFLQLASCRQPLGRVATIGRQSIHVDSRTIRKELHLPESQEFGSFCEELLTVAFSASSVTSFDHSPYEGATRLHDMNLPLEVGDSYDTVFDGGSVEHVYDVACALDNVSRLCAVGGQILHVLPANNFCGHGFWQLSPELFFSLYAPENGYEGTDVFIADVWDERHWYRVPKPSAGKRVNVVSKSPLHILVRTVRTTDHFSHGHVHQSDYVHLWTAEQSGESWAASLKSNVKLSALAPWARWGINRYRSLLAATLSVGSRNRELSRERIASIVEAAASGPDSVDSLGDSPVKREISERNS
jgi:SAM-dependent methyltransferase